MNIHPILVHFPVALLTIYSIMELIRWKKITNQPYWFYVKAVVICIGGLGALAALSTGDTAVEGLRQGLFTPAVTDYMPVVHLHETFADISIAIFGLLAASYLITWINQSNFAGWLSTNNLTKTLRLPILWRVLGKIAAIIQKPALLILLAIVGLIAITITGGLGGVLVFGPDADPFFKVIYQLLLGA